jgi:transglutaminase-like putative cysteine protease
MRIHIRHEVEHSFEPPVRFLNAILRLTPRSHESQHVVRWRVEIDGDSRIRAFDDPFGNCMHTLSMAAHTDKLHILAEGVIETFDAAGIVRATVERFPPELFLRETALTEPDERLRAIAGEILGDHAIERLHALLLRISGSDRAGESGRSQQGSAQKQAQASAESTSVMTAASPDRAKALAHDFIVCARLMGAPARFVSGYFVNSDATGDAHFWTEAYADGVGWIGFDPANEICPHESHIRMAIGLDALDAAGVRASPNPLAVKQTVEVRRQG